MDLTYVGSDRHFMPVYKDKDGVYYKDVDPRPHVSLPLIYRMNETDVNAPVIEMVRGQKFKFHPKRRTW